MAISKMAVWIVSRMCFGEVPSPYLAFPKDEDPTNPKGMIDLSGCHKIPRLRDHRGLGVGFFWHLNIAGWWC